MLTLRFPALTFTSSFHVSKFQRVDVTVTVFSMVYRFGLCGCQSHAQYFTHTNLRATLEDRNSIIPSFQMGKLRPRKTRGPPAGGDDPGILSPVL